MGVEISIFTSLNISKKKPRAMLFLAAESSLPKTSSRFSVTVLLNSMLLSPLLLERVVTREFLFARWTNCRLLRAWLSMLLRNIITHLLFTLCIKMKVWTLMFLLFFTSLSAAFWRLYINPQVSDLTFSFRLRAGII